MKKKSTNGLYAYIEDFYQQLLTKNFRITFSQNPNHQAFYVSIDLSVFNFGDWTLVEKHLTIERNAYKESANKMGNHCTLQFNHQTNKDLICKIHAYLDDQGHFNGVYQKKIFDKSNKSIEAATNILTYDYDNHSVPTENLGPNLSKLDIREQSVACQKKLIELLKLKNEKYQSLFKEIQTIDDALGKATINLERIKSDQACRDHALAMAKQYREFAKTLTRYSDLQEYSQHFLEDMIRSLESMVVKKRSASKNSKKNVADTTSSFIIEQKPNIQLASHLTTTQKLSPQEFDQKEIQNQISILKDFDCTNANALGLIEFMNKLAKVKHDLILYDLIYDDPKDKKFIKSQRSLIGEGSEKDLAKRLFDKILDDGDNSFITSENFCSSVKIDFLDLFEKLWSKIELLADTAPLSHPLIEIAHYFYENSTLYRSFLLFRTTDYYPMCSRDTRVGLLVTLYIEGRFNAFCMYLQQKAPLNVPAYTIGTYQFGVIPGILLASDVELNECPPLFPFLKALLEHHAPISCVTFKASFLREYAGQSKTTLTFFQEKQLNQIKTLVSDIPPLPHDVEMQVECLASAKNILELGLQLAIKDLNVLLMIAEQLSEETCLLALTRTLSIFQGQLFFVPFQPQLEVLQLFADIDSLREFDQSLPRDRELTSFEALSIRFFLYIPNTKKSNFGDFIKCLQEFNDYVVNRIKKLSPEEIQILVTNLIRCTIKEKLLISKNQSFINSLPFQSYVLAAMIAQGLNTVSEKNCMVAFQLLMFYIDINKARDDTDLGSLVLKALESVVSEHLARLVQNEDCVNMMKKTKQCESVMKFFKIVTEHNQNEVASSNTSMKC